MIDPKVSEKEIARRFGVPDKVIKNIGNTTLIFDHYEDAEFEVVDSQPLTVNQPEKAK